MSPKYLSLLAFLAVVMTPSSVHSWKWWSPFSSSTTPYWDDCVTTFALDFLNPLASLADSLGIRQRQSYQKIPRTQGEAENSGWVSIGDSCENGGRWNGNRYAFQINASFVDASATVLFDKRGVIAGLQMNINVTEAKANPNNTYQFDKIPMFLKNVLNGNEQYTLTAYFVDPSTICSTGRNATDLTNGAGTGTQLSFQNGTNPSALIVAPMNRTVALQQNWSDNNCFIGMGVHNWYEQEKLQETNCDYILPVFLLYNKQDGLLGFGFQHVGRTTSASNRFENPDDKAVKMIVGKNVSQCLWEKARTTDVGVTTFHVYLISNPGSQLCVV